MSYDYILVKGNTGASLEALVEGAMSQTIGAVEHVKASIDGLFPSVRWQKGPPSSANNNISGWSGRTDTAEFMFLVEPDGQVRMLHMSRCERAEVERVTRELGLVALDEQSMEQFGG